MFHADHSPSRAYALNTAFIVLYVQFRTVYTSRGMLTHIAFVNIGWNRSAGAGQNYGGGSAENTYS
jgi:hypothetical protein